MKSKITRLHRVLDPGATKLILLTASTASLLHALFFVLQTPSTALGDFAVITAAFQILITCLFLQLSTERLFYFSLLLFCIELLFFVYQLSRPVSFTVPRMLQVTLILFYSAILLSFLLTATRITRMKSAIMLSLSLAFSILSVEMVMGILSPDCCVVYEGVFDRHPQLQMIVHPHTIMRTLYPGNPRKYFAQETALEANSWLRVESGDAASVSFYHNDTEDIRVEIERIASTRPFDTQLNVSHFKVHPKERYAIKFRARSDKPRAIYLGFAHSHDPWSGIGLYERIQTSTGWQSFERRFETTEADENARIHFDLGAVPVSVEVGSIHLIRLRDDQDLLPAGVKNRYYIDYRSNALSCRGGDYPIPKPSGVKRVLVLGDSYTQGIGVREEDTFSNRLQNLLNKKVENGLRYDVINCGMFGYATKQERSFYEIFGHKYAPDVVLLVAIYNDDHSYWDQLNLYPKTFGRLQEVFLLWKMFEEYRYRPPLPDFSQTIEDVLRLNKDVQSQNAHLAVVLFRNTFDYAGITYEGKCWNRLASAMHKGLNGSSIPVLDLSPPLNARSSERDLTVYPNLDAHPNEVAHAIASQEIYELLGAQHWVKQ